MRDLHHMFRYGWLILLIGLLGLRTSAMASSIPTGSLDDQRSPVVSKLVLGSVWGLSLISSDRCMVSPVYRLAYVDPGSGQLVLQMLLAGCVGALFYIKRVRDFLGRLVAKWFKKKG
jgi:hypothetical protein